MKLNIKQLQAIRHKHGPLMIVAGAGTGKTTVITERIKYLISSGLAKPSEILALTFTEKAAREMEERVDIAMPYGYTQMWISTFHRFCDQILRQEALQIGFNPKYRLLTETEATQLIRKNLFEFDLDYFRPLGNPTKFIGGMLQHFSRLQDEDVSPSDYLRWAKIQNSKFKIQNKEQKIEVTKWMELAKAYQKYEELKIKEGVFDFGDLIVKTLQLFRSRPNVLKEYQRQFKFVLVDEYQDTNITQNELVKLLAKKSGNITVVLDDDQSIYRFRGAAISNALQFRKNFPDAKVVTLTKNYRSSQEILDKAYNLIQFNNPDRLEVAEKIDKKLVAKKKFEETEVGFIHTDRVENEADEVAKKIKSLSEKYEWRDFAILVRANNHAEPFARALGRHGIPYQFLGPGRLFRKPEVVDLISYLRVLDRLDDSVSLYRVLSMDIFAISPREVAKIGSFAKRNNLTLFEALEKVDDIFVSQETKIKVKKILKVIDRHLKLLQKETAGQILYYFLEEFEILPSLLNPKSVEAEEKAANISKFFDKLKTYEVDHEDASVSSVVDWIDLASELGESPLANDTDWYAKNAVNILTVHSSKGLEFPVVFLVNLAAGRFPTYERREQIPISEELIKEVLPKGDYHLEEERRLFYVGMTRAMERLYLTVADYYGEGKREKKLSPFILEALGDEVVSSEIKGVREQLSFLDYSTPKTLSTKHEIPKLHIDYLSYSQIETFKTCPLHYRLRYILNVPTPPSASQSFGVSIHSALRFFYEDLKKGERPSEELLLFKLSENWIREGYASKSHEQKSFEKAKRYLREYYKSEFDPGILPIVLEQQFRAPLPSKEKERPLVVGGKIDRVDDLGNGVIEIIDYKTGVNVPTQKEIDHDLQLTFYALCATLVKEIPFGKRPEEVKLTLYYFDNQKKITTVRTEKQLNEATEEIYEIRRQIEGSDFRCSGGILCRSCEYKLYCNVD